MTVVPHSVRVLATEAAGRLNTNLARGLEQWILHAFLPSMRADAVPRKLYGPKGRRRDEDEQERLQQLSNTKRKGTLSAVLAALGHRSLGFETMKARNRLYHFKRRDSFNGEYNVSNTWDPATYRGEASNIGILWGCNVQQACHLQVQVLRQVNRLPDQVTH